MTSSSSAAAAGDGCAPAMAPPPPPPEDGKETLAAPNGKTTVNTTSNSFATSAGGRDDAATSAESSSKIVVGGGSNGGGGGGGGDGGLDGSSNDDSGAGDRERESYKPLSWDEAREAVVQTLLERIRSSRSSSSSSSDDAASATNQSHPQRRRKRGRWWTTEGGDSDLYLALLASTSFLALSSCTLSGARDVRDRDDHDGSVLTGVSAEIGVYRAQLASAVLITLSSLLSVFVIIRRRLSANSIDGVGSGVRRAAKTFLRSVEGLSSSHLSSEEDEIGGKEHGGAGDAAVEEKEVATEAAAGGEDNGRNQDGGGGRRCGPVVRISGTPLTDVYPAFRLKSSSSRHAKDDGGSEEAREREGEWHRIPTLLLAKGDCVALQVGDTAPARCELLSSAANEAAAAATTAKVVIEAGERLTADLLPPRVAASVPPGRFALPPRSLELLDLCNDTRLFRLRETPLEAFLRREHAEHKTPQIIRKGSAVRSSLQHLAIAVFILTAAFISVRPDIFSSDISLVLTLPFLAALGVLPVVSPLCLFVLEIVGTARILAAVHPHASFQRRRAGMVASKWRQDEEEESMDEPCLIFNDERLLFLRYVAATVCARLNLDAIAPSEVLPGARLLPVPAASSFLLEKLGAVTVLALIDDELACEPCSTPQQLLIPCGHGMKLLDLCPTYEDDAEVMSLDTDDVNHRDRDRKIRSKSLGSSHDDDHSDSDDSDETGQRYQHTFAPRRTLKAIRRHYRRKVSGSSSTSRRNFVASRLGRSGAARPTDDNEVQFEDPQWWQHLPSLKCIGLACLLADDVEEEMRMNGTSEKCDGVPSREPSLLDTPHSRNTRTLAVADSPRDHLASAEASLVNHIRRERSRSHLTSLARCIGFSSERNAFGTRGDLSPFQEQRRLHVISTRLLRDRLAMDTHALGLEDSRSWGLLQTDSTSVIVQDSRSKAFQLLTVSDARLVGDFCSDSWDGENSTISPLSSADQRSILDTSNNWMLSDLDVAAFSYAPVPFTLEQKISGGISRGQGVAAKATYLVDNTLRNATSTPSRDVGDWNLVRNQIFLGLLGSAVSPRKEIEHLIDQCSSAGVRFVYFSPRNMRRTKELASQMGIDVAWNCAISLRPLDEGQEDHYRMTSTYADWDVNARLPHGIEDVKRHLEEVDNVPLLVSLFTDVTKKSTTEMVDVFQDYNDTVLAIGVSHFSRNERTFAQADLSIGVDVLAEEVSQENDVISSSEKQSQHPEMKRDSLLPEEVFFVSSISTHPSIFNLKGSATISQVVPEIIAQARAALEAVTSASLFVVSGCVTFSLFVLFCSFSAATVVPFVPALGSVLYLQLVLPLIALTIAMTGADAESMNRVPAKNDIAVVFSPKEGRRLYTHTLLRAVPSAVAPQLLFLIAFGELVLEYEPNLVQTECSVNVDDGGVDWASVIRCDALRDYSGDAKTSAGALMLAELVLCVMAVSASYVFGTNPLLSEKPWRKNRAWVYGVVAGLVLVVVYLSATLRKGVLSALPWYFYILAISMPFGCLACSELVKRKDRRHENRAVMMRRLQFETRLGMWSPKESTGGNR